MTDVQELRLRPNQQAFVNRFVEACNMDDRIVAAFLGGSYAKGTADAYSDIDLCIITTDRDYEEFLKGREAFLHLLGELLFLEDFELPNIAFYIFADGTEGELYFGSETHLDDIHSGSFRRLLDKKNILTGAVFSEHEPAPAEQIEKLRRHIYWFWHDLSHFITAMGRGQLWWAQGQLEVLRSICVNLARLHYNFTDADGGEEAYFKIEKAMPVEQLRALRETFCPMEKEAMLMAGFAILHFYQELTPFLAQTHGIAYPDALERVTVDRLEKMSNAQVKK